MGAYNLAWALVLVPLAGALMSFLAESQRRAAQICVAFTGVTFILALIVLGLRLTHQAQAPYTGFLTFFTMSPPEGTLFATRFEPQFGVLVDALSAGFATAIAFLALVAQAHALRWLRASGAYRRFFWASSLLTFAGLAFVLSPNIFESLFMWMVASAAIYVMALHRPDADDAAASAGRVFAVLRCADVALFLAVVYGFLKFGPYASLQPAPAGEDINDPFSFTTIAQAATGVVHGHVPGSGPKTLAILASLVIFAAIVRSGQLAFRMWLRDLGGITLPALAMVAGAGCAMGGILVARVYPLLTLVPHALSALGIAAAVGALLAAVAALRHRDLRRIVPLAAAVEVGLALTALGAGGYSQGLFVLFAAGFVNLMGAVAAANLVRVYRSSDIRDMGGAWRRMRLTSVGLWLWALALGGLSMNTYWALSGVVAGGGVLVHLSTVSRVVIAVLVLATGVVSALLAVRVALAVSGGRIARRRGFQEDRVREVEPPMRRWTFVAAVGLVVAVVLRLPVVGPALVHAGTHRSALPVDGAALVLSLAALAAGAALAWVLSAPRRRERVAAAEERLWALPPAWLGEGILTAPGALGRGFVLAGATVSAFDTRVVDGIGAAVADVPAAVWAAARGLRLTRRTPALYLAGSVLVAGALALLSVLAATGHLWVRTA